jgi:hypothetical protein
MTLPRKTSHPIVVEGINFRWCIGKREHPGQALGFTDRVIVQADGRGAPLIRILGWEPYDQLELTPRVVAEFIQDALRDGWKPLEPGAPFRQGRPY